MTPLLLRGIGDDPDPGIHGAIDWLLRHGREGPEPGAPRLGTGGWARRHRPRAEWPPPRAKGRGLSITASRPLSSSANRPCSTWGRRPTNRLAWTTSASSSAHRPVVRPGLRPVTVGEYDLFLKDRPKVKRIATKDYSPEPDCPMIGVSWYAAAKYCNWLSEKDRIPEAPARARPREQGHEQGRRPLDLRRCPRGACRPAAPIRTPDASVRPWSRAAWPASRGCGPAAPRRVPAPGAGATRGAVMVIPQFRTYVRIRQVGGAVRPPRVPATGDRQPTAHRYPDAAIRRVRP